MNVGQTVFAQLMDHLPAYEFKRCVARYRGDAHFRGFSCWDQYLAMGFAQLTYRESLRDIEACLYSVSAKLYHMGFRGRARLHHYRPLPFAVSVGEISSAQGRRQN